MFLYTFICFICFTLYCISQLVVCDETISHYLEERSDFVSKSLKGVRKISGNGVVLEFYHLQPLYLRKTYKHATVFSVFNETHLLMDTNIYVLDENYEMKPLQIIDDEIPIAFVKDVSDKNLAIAAFISTNGPLKIYGKLKNETDLSFFHSIATESCTDVNFFKQNDDLYMIIVTRDNLEIGACRGICVFKWIGAHFDKISEITTSEAVAVDSFPSDNDRIIVVLQENTPSMVYVFNSNKLRKLQKLSTKNPSHVISYEIEGRYQVAIFDGDFCKTYFWNGAELFLLKSIQYSIIDKIFVNYIDNQPIVFTTRNTTLTIFKPTPTGVISQNISIDLRENHNNISTIIPIFQRNYYTLFIHTLNKTDILLPFSVRFNKTDIQQTEDGTNELLYCLKSLGNVLENYEKEKVAFRKNIERFRSSQLKQLSGAAHSRNSETLTGKTREIFENLQSYLKALRRKAGVIQESLEELFDKSVLGNATIKGNLVAQTVTTGSLWNVKELNNEIWNPNFWLFYDKKQIVTAPVFAKTIMVKNLKPYPNDPIFQNLLLRSGTQTLTGTNQFINLSAKKITCNVINKIPFDAIYLKSQNVGINGTKTFGAIQARNITVKNLNKKSPHEILNGLSDPKPYHFTFNSRFKVKNLTFKEINGISWEEFNKSVFKLGKNNRISGNLKINQLNVKYLKAKSIDGVDVNDLFTTNTDQTVDSVIHFQGVNIAKSFNCNKINGLDLSNDVVTFTPDDVIVIKDPVSITNFKAYETLLIDSSKPAFASIQDKNHSVLQIYHEKVKIIGNVVLSNAFLDPFTKVTVNGNLFQISMLENYWLKNDFQIIPVHVTFQKGLSIPQLLTSKLNGIDVRNYMVQNVENKNAGNFYFENITILGDVFLNPQKPHWPDFRAIDNGSVKYCGSYLVKDRKSFEGIVTVKHLKTATLDNTDLNKTIQKNTNIRVTGRKHFETLVITNDLKANSSVINKINGINLKLLQMEAMYVDKTTTLAQVNFKNLSVENLRVNSVNGKPFNDFITERKKLSNNGLVSVSFLGNVTINNAKIRFINGISVNEIASRMLNNTVVVSHDVHLPGSVHIKNLRAAKINGVDISRISKRLLYKNYEQIIIAPFSFNNIVTDNLYTESINNVNLNHLFQTNGNFSVRNNKNLKNVKFIKSLTAKSMSCDFGKAIQAIENPTKAKWKTIGVKGNLEIANETSKLLNFVKNIVTTNSNNVITAPVTFDGQIFANIVTTSGTINNVNITKIKHDAIFNNVKGKPITISGNNVFEKLKAAEITVRGNAAISEVNKIRVRKVNSSIIHKGLEGNYVIRGKKTFLGGVEIYRLYARSLAGMKPENMVNLKNLRVIPRATFDRLIITNNLNIKKVNNVNMQWFYENRVLCQSDTLQILEGTYHFDKMLLNNAVKTPHLNHLAIKDIVVDGNLQHIKSEKIFLNDVFTSGNIRLDLLNDINLTQYHQNSVFTVQNETINGNIKIKSNNSHLSNMNLQTLNGVSIERLKYILNFHDPEIVAASTGNTLQTINSIVDRSSKNLRSLPDKLMYIQKATSIRADLPPLQDSRVIQLTRNSTLLLLDGQISGAFCGLPSDCPCPNEHSVYFAPGKIVVDNNTINRVFKYKEEEFYVSLNTTAVSVSSYCRTNYSKIINEFTQLSWKNVKTKVGGARKILGYLSGAEFFTYADRVYVIYCEYYNSVFDSHELYCTVLRSDNEKEDFEEIQLLPVKGAWKTHLLYTAQGIVLIIGNVVPGISNHTDIYRFNPMIQKFELLRDVKTIGCTAVAGVVLGNDSLLILAQPESPIQILKYDNTLDNYYYYQSFSLDSPVVGVSVFYNSGFGISDAYLCVVMVNGGFNIYSFKEIEGWKLESTGGITGLMDLIPFEMDGLSYLFAPSSLHTKLLSLVKHSYV